MTVRVFSTRSQLPGGGLRRLADRFQLVRPTGDEPAELHELAAGMDAILALSPDRPGGTPAQFDIARVSA